MKTLLQINTNVGWNSTGRIAEDLGRLAIDRGWESYIAYGRNMNGIPQSASHLLRVGTDKDIWMHGLQTRLFDRHGLASKKATSDLITRIEEINPDVIHLHNIHGYYLNYPIFFKYLARTGIPVVWTLHDCWPFTGHCAYFDIANCSRWLNGCSKCPLKAMYPASLMSDRSAENYELKKELFTSIDNLHIVAVSDWLKNVVRKSFLDKYPTYLIYNGIDMPLKPSRNVRKEPLVLGAASKWDHRKGLDTFVALRSKLSSEYRMVIVGLSAQQIRSLPSGIEGLPRINERASLNEWYRRAAVYVNPSLIENLSSTNLEAQAVGTPVVAFDSGGMNETVSRDTGILVKTGDVDGMANAIRRITSESGRFTSAACQKFIREKFNKMNNYGTYIDLYESLVDTKHIKIPELVP